jgi:hypothetical protein
MQRLVLLYGLRTSAVLSSVLQLMPSPKDVLQVPRNYSYIYVYITKP